jgi:outer membrane cobalamin receptor
MVSKKNSLLKPDRLSGFLMEVYSVRTITVSMMILILASATGFGQSEEEPYRLPDTVIVTAERFRSPISKIIWPAKALTATRIASKNSVAEALDGVAGTDLTGYGGIGHLSNIMIWGSPSSQTLLLYDGRPVYNYTSGGFNLSDYNSEELERIEIVKGTQSSFYGSDAIAGAINLIPRFNYRDKITSSLSYGSFGQFNYDFGVGHEIGDIFLNADYYGGEVDNDRTNSGVKRDCLAVKSRYFPEDGAFEIKSAYRYFQDSLGLPGATPNPDNIPYYGDIESQSTVNYQRDFNHSFDFTFSIGENSDEEDQSPEIAFGVFYEKKKLEYSGRYAYLYGQDSTDAADRNNIFGRNSGIFGKIRKRINKFDLSGGAEFLSGSSAYDAKSRIGYFNLASGDSSFSDNRTYRRHRRDTYAGWSGATYNPTNHLSLNFSGRLEAVNGDEIYESYNMGIKYAFGANLSAGLAYGMAYRLPSFNDLYWPDDGFTEGNSSLTPEKGRNVVFSMLYSPQKSIKFNVNLFAKSVKDLISWAPVGRANSYGSPRWIPSNLNKFESGGFDCGIYIKSSDNWRISCDLAYQSATQTNKELIFSGLDGTQLFESKERDAAYIPEWKYRFGGAAELMGFEFGGDLVYTSRKVNYFAVYNYDESYNSIISYFPKWISDNYVVGVFIRKDINMNVSIMFSVNDLFDEKPVRQFGSLTDLDYRANGRTINLKIFLKN